MRRLPLEGERSQIRLAAASRNFEADVWDRGTTAVKVMDVGCQHRFTALLQERQAAGSVERIPGFRRTNWVLQRFSRVYVGSRRKPGAPPAYRRGR
jgi:hypothetical protein